MKDTVTRRRGGWQALQRSLRRPGSWQRLLLGAVYGASILTTGFIIWKIVAAPGTGPIGNSRDYLYVLVGLNLALLLGLLAIVGWRVVRSARSRADAGSRLHIRFVSLFALAAVLPAVVVALSFIVLNRGIDTWFSERMKSAVNNGAEIGRSYQTEETQIAAVGAAEIHTLIESSNARTLFADRLAFAIALKGALAQHWELDAIYVIDDTGQVLARAEDPGALVYVAPPRSVLDDVRLHGPGGFIPTGDAVRYIYPQPEYNNGNAFLYVVRKLPPGMAARLKSGSDATAAVREAQQNESGTRFLFSLTYIEAVLLVLSGAIWIGTSAAESIAGPVARLVQAADRVAGGDLNARVHTTRQSEDIAVLSRAFNRMTSDLQSQQQALKSAGEEAESRRRFIETVLSEISAGIVGLDVLEHISAINRHAANFLGVPAEEALGVNIREAAPEIAELLDKASVHRVEEQEVDIVRKGETRRVRVRASGLETGGAVLTFDDITRLVTAQRNAAWRDVARRIAHEIKNPLTPIQLSAERLRKKYRGQIEQDGETFDRLTDTIVRQVGDIGRMVDEFSSFARMPAPNFAEEDAAELVRATVFSQRVARQDVAIELVEPLPEVKVVCDGRMFGQALGNVLKNGGEAISSRLSRDGQAEIGEGIVGHIRVEVFDEPGFLTIAVEDDGIGLPEKDRDRLTEPYVTTREKGTGLGLAIVKRILEDHGGEFFLTDATTLSGARAVLRLPRTQTSGISQSTTETPAAAGGTLMRV